jgi:hypothetical protein
MDPTKEQHQILYKSLKIAIETLAMIGQAFGEEIISRARKVQTHKDRKCENGEERSQEHGHHPL